MKIHFEPNLPHQTAAINAVVKVFEGTPYSQPSEKLWAGCNSGNVLQISAEKIPENVTRIRHL